MKLLSLFATLVDNKLGVLVRLVYLENPIKGSKVSKILVEHYLELLDVKFFALHPKDAFWHLFIKPKHCAPPDIN